MVSTKFKLVVSFIYRSQIPPSLQHPKVLFLGGNPWQQTIIRPSPSACVAGGLSEPTRNQRPLALVTFYGVWTISSWRNGVINYHQPTVLTQNGPSICEGSIFTTWTPSLCWHHVWVMMHDSPWYRCGNCRKMMASQPGLDLLTDTNLPSPPGKIPVERFFELTKVYHWVWILRLMLVSCCFYYLKKILPSKP